MSVCLYFFVFCIFTIVERQCLDGDIEGKLALLLLAYRSKHAYNNAITNAVKAN